MTYSKLPGTYFTESTSTVSEYNQSKIPLFLVQTSTAITGLDGVITYYSGLEAFKTDVSGKGLDETVKHIEQALVEYGTNNFYVYSIKTDTATAFTDTIKATAHLKDVPIIDYFEETKSANGNAITSKIAAIKAGVIDNAANGVFRVAYITPYGTVADAVENAENTTSEAAAIASLTTILTGNGHGRIAIILPDENSGIVAGKCFAAAYDEDPGFTAVETSINQSTYNFDNIQMITLQNLGVLFINGESIQGVTQNKINLGVTTSFKESASDGLLIARNTVDEVLREIDFVSQAFIKAKETPSNLAALKAEVSNVVDKYVKEESIVKAGTNLTVTDAGNNVFNITGTIQPIGCVIAIEVNTTIQ